MNCTLNPIKYDRSCGYSHLLQAEYEIPQLLHWIHAPRGILVKPLMEVHRWLNGTLGQSRWWFPDVKLVFLPDKINVDCGPF